MRRSSLGLVLIALNLGLALVVVAGLAGSAAALFRRATNDQAFDRVQRAAAGAEKGIAHAGEATASTALLLASESGAWNPVGLERFRSLNGLSAAAVVSGGRT